MISAKERKIKQPGGEVRFDNLTRQLYATDASIYQIEPAAVAFPRSAREASAVIHAAADAGVSVTPRGAGTSLVGNAIGDGLIVEFSRYNRQINDFDLEKRSVCLCAGRGDCCTAGSAMASRHSCARRTISRTFSLVVKARWLRFFPPN